MSFAKRFIALRESRGWTQEDVAEKLGVSRPTIAGYESEKKGRIPRNDTLPKIAKLFNVSMGHLMGDEEKPISNSSQGKDDELRDIISRLPQDKKKIVIDVAKGFLDE